MTDQLFDELFEKWKYRELKYQKNNKRKFLHFDCYIQFHKNIQFFKSFFKNSLINVAQHGFYPMIKSDIVSPRLKHEKDLITGKKKLVKKKKIRPISYASHFDSYIYSWYSMLLTFYYEKKIADKKIQDCVLAYLEKGKSNIEFSHEVFEFVKTIATLENECVALAFDLSSFFDGLDHEILKEKWCDILDITNNRLPKDHFHVFKSLTDYTFVKKENLEVFFPIPVGKGGRIDRFCTPQQFRDIVIKNKLIEKNPFTNQLANSEKKGVSCGIPQGSPMSATLSNIYLIDFDVTLDLESKMRGGLYRRYCDDLIVICKREDKDFFSKLIIDSIEKYEVIINNDKTEITYFKKIITGN